MTEQFESNLGTKIEIGDGATPEVYTEIPFTRTIPDLDITQEKIETTHQQSTSRSYIPSGLGAIDDYEFEIEEVRTNAVHTKLRTMLAAHTKANFRKIDPDGFAQQFPAYVLGMKRADADPQDPDVILTTVSLAVSGEVTDVSDTLLS